MDAELVQRSEKIQSRLKQLAGSLDHAGKADQIKQIEAKMAEAGFWDDNESAQKTVSELKGLKVIVGPLDELSSSVDDMGALMEMADEDESIAGEVADEIKRLEDILDELELKALLNGPNDSAGAILTINARDGGTDANDWADMMLRMYSAWAVAQDYKLQLLDRHDNEEAGINSASIAIRGAMAYGYLKGEEGVHRLVRISPFNSEGKRQTSFAAVSVSPEIDDSFEIEIEEKDVRTDTFRASGAGGQHVNKTDSAVSTDTRSHQHRRGLSERTQSASKPRHRMEDAAGKNGSARRRKTRSRSGREVWDPSANGIWQSDSQLLPTPRPARQGCSHGTLRRQLQQRARRQRTAGIPGRVPPLARRR